MRRLEPLTLGGVGSSGTVKTQLVALRIISENPSVIGGRSYSLKVCNSHQGSAEGTATFTLANGDGGTFDSTFDVTPRLVFTQVGNPSNIVVIDCSVSPPAARTCWRTTRPGCAPAGRGASTPPQPERPSSGTASVLTATAMASTREPPTTPVAARRSSRATAPVTFKPVSSGHDHEQQQRFHQVVPVTDCLTTTTAEATNQAGRAVAIEPAPKPIYCAKAAEPVGTVN